MASTRLLTRRSGVSGSGVFAVSPIEVGRPVLQFTGPVLDRRAHGFALDNSKVDEFLQIAADRYLGPSGGLDDFVNHSCDPNCGLVFGESEIWLASVSRIRAGDEICFDYATTQDDYPYRFRCRCGSPNCRSEIGDFAELSASLKRRYHTLGILAPWLSERYLKDRGAPRPPRQTTSSSSVFSSPE